MNRTTDVYARRFNLPQIVPKLNIFIKHGGYEPTTGFHFNTIAELNATSALILTNALRPLISTQATITKWEGRTAAGTYVDGGILGLYGTNGANFQDFRDDTHIVWLSDGPARPSGNFLPGRTSAQWILGTPYAGFVTDLEGLRDAFIGLDGTDSEGAFITGFRSYAPGRRRHVRLAP